MDTVLYLELPRTAFVSRRTYPVRRRGMDWDEFFNRLSEWSEAELLQAVEELEYFGPSDEVCEAVCRMPSFHLENLLYHRALQQGVCFRKEELAEMGHLPQRQRGAIGKLLDSLMDRWNYYRGGDDWADWEVVRE